MVGRREPDTISGQKAVEKIRNVWEEYRAGKAPIEEINIILGEKGTGPTDWEDGVITVAEEMNKGRYGTGNFENTVFPMMENAFEETIEREIKEQRDILEERFSFLDNFGIEYNGVQVAELEDAGAHLGDKVNRFLDNTSGTNYIVVDFSYFPWIDPLEDEVEGPAERVIRHETVHAMQRSVNPEFREVWRQTGSRDIRRASTEGLARYEQYKGTEKDRTAEKVIENPVEIPDFWRSKVIEDKDASDPYSYGELAAYFLEEAYRKEKMEDIVEENEEPYPAVRVSDLDKYAERKVRETFIDNPKKQDLDSELEEAAKYLDFQFFGNIVEQQYKHLNAYLAGEKDYTEKLASPEGKPSLVRVKKEEDAAERDLESTVFAINHTDYGIEDYLKAEAKLVAADQLDFRPEAYHKLEETLNSSEYENNQSKTVSA